VSGSQDQTLMVWQVNLEDQTDSTAVATLEGHQAGIEVVEVSPNGDFVRSETKLQDERETYRIDFRFAVVPGIMRLRFGV